ncbi:MAG: AMP-binding protein, partial [Spirochaetaceae bacterium]|nr:AMP-binding protein [Spirochaetaceae bacterium]
MVPKRYELTKSQKEILIVSNKSEICSQSFNESFILTFSCGIDIDLIIDSITSTFHKHDLLSAVLDRDSLTWKTESSELFLVEEYVSSDNEMSLLEDRINRHVYDLETGPLVRFFIIKEEEKISLCIHSHHILVDGYSMNLLLEDISFFYREGTNFDKVAGDFSHSFEDLIHAEKLDEYNMTEGIEFWKESLQNVPLPQDLPWNTRSGKQKLYEGDSTFYTINPEELQRIEQKAKEYKLSLHNFLLAMLFFVRHKLTDEKESVIGCPISSQNYYGLHGIFGNAVNLLPVKFIVDDRESVSQYFSRFKKNFVCFANWTYNEILEKIPVKRSADRNPLIEMMFNLSTDQENWAFKDISYRTSRFKKIATNFDLYINCRLTSSSLNIAIDYNTNVYNEESIEKFYGCFKNVLDQICTDEVDNVKELNLLSNDQQIQKIQEWKGYLSAIDHSFVKDIIDNTTIYSERVAISGADISLTYKQLDILSNLVAQRLLINHSDSDVIGIAMTRTPYLVPVMLGILRAGKSYIPLDLDFPEDRLHYIIADSEIKCIIADEIPLDFVRSLDDNILLIDSAKIIKDEQNYPYDQKTLPEIGSDDPAYILYTSGSTG